MRPPADDVSYEGLPAYQGETLEIRGRQWRTPLTLPDSERHEMGAARLIRTRYRSGWYRMEGLAGHELYRIKGDLPVTALQRRDERGRWKTWMVDDPLHWYGMRQRVQELPAGSVLIAGLGLGLMLHHLADRTDINEITVVELDADVIRLVGPTTPVDERVTLVRDDFYHHIRTAPAPDSVLWDLAVGGPDETRADITRARVAVGLRYPETPLYLFGVRDPGPTPPLGFPSPERLAALAEEVE